MSLLRKFDEGKTGHISQDRLKGILNGKMKKNEITKLLTGRFELKEIHFIISLFSRISRI